MSRVGPELIEDEVWEEWVDGDDSRLYDEGYQDGIIKAIEIIDSVRNVEHVERVPFHITMSAVASTLREIAKGN